MTLTDALDTFRDHLPEIIDAMALNLAIDLQTEKKDAEQLGTGEIADMVREIRRDLRFGDRVKRLNRVTSYHNAILHPTPGRITDADIERAKSIPIQELCTTKLRKQGAKLWGQCEFHTEKTASMCIDTKRNNWRCFGTCGIGGDAIDYYMKQNNVDFIRAVKKLANCG